MPKNKLVRYCVGLRPGIFPPEQLYVRHVVRGGNRRSRRVLDPQELSEDGFVKAKDK